ncbi:MAG: hypothetical protein ACXVKA_10220 [Acidimicrobiia bacterium]
MAIPVLIVLAALWGAFFLWPILSGRSSGRRADSIGDFSYRLGVIGKTGGHHGRRRRASQPPAIPVAMPPAIPPSRPLGAPGGAGMPVSVVRPAAMSRSQRRRRDVLLILGVGVLSSLLLAIVGGNPMFWLVQGFTDVLLVAYLALLVRMKQTANERRAKVHYLPSPPSAPALVLRRTSVSS